MSEAETPNNQPNLSESSPNPSAKAGGESFPSLSPTEITHLITQIQQQRQHNTELLNRVVQLEAELEKAAKSLHEFQQRPAADALLSQRLNELNTVQEHNSRLLRELELSHQTAQRQQILIETLTEQLETNQQQVAHLERECASLQQRYNEQTTKLSQTEKTCRDLQTRLYRQQRYTLQFKNALEKSLEISVPDQQPTEVAPPTKPRYKSDLGVVDISQGVIPKAPAIQPWSATPRFGEDLMDFEPEIEQFSPQPAASQASPSEIIEPPAPAIALKSYLEGEETIPPVTPDNRDEAENVDFAIDEAEMEILEDCDRDSTFIDVKAVEALQTTSIDEETLEQFVEETAESTPLLTQPNWPSPVVYPLRPHKKIKSLAAIDLPSFPRR